MININNIIHVINTLIKYECASLALVCVSMNASFSETYRLEQQRLCLLSPCSLGEETAREMTVSYAAGTCSPEERANFESHCLICEECRSILAIVLRLLYSPIDEKELGPLYPLGIEAGIIACWLTSDVSVNFATGSD